MRPVLRVGPCLGGEAISRWSPMARMRETGPPLLGLYEPIPGYRVAIIDDKGRPVELIESRWPTRKSGDALEVAHIHVFTETMHPRSAGLRHRGSAA
jgi:hypothetical protein